jgi:hypothetical protein
MPALSIGCDKSLNNRLAGQNETNEAMSWARFFFHRLRLKPARNDWSRAI